MATARADLSDALILINLEIDLHPKVTQVQ